MKNSMTGRKKKPNYVAGLVLLLLTLYVGYTIGLMSEFGDLKIKNAEQWPEAFLRHLLHPFPLVWSDAVKRCMAITACVVLICWMYYTGQINNRIAGREYGTARFAEPEEITKKLSFRRGGKKILGHRMTISTNDRKTALNNNALVIGGSGAGKSFRFVKPNILSCNSSMVITDPKGELLRDTGAFLKRHGYVVKVFNLVEPMRSDRYNPFAYIRTKDDVVQLVDIIIKNTTPKNANISDPFWEKAENMYLQSLVFYVWLVPQMEGRRNMKSLISLMGEASIPENEKEKSPLDKRMEALLTEEWELADSLSGEKRRYPGIEHPAYETYYKFRVGAVDTTRSILISANSRMSFISNSPQLLDMISDDDMDIPSIGMNRNQKTALFCIIPDAKTTYNAVAGMLYSQIFQELYYQADNNTKNGRLPVGVSFWFDEFANIAMPNDFTAMLSTMRSRGISANIIIQNLSQLKARYNNDWETITGNCDTLVYLGGNEQSTHKYISELLGKWTVEKRSVSASTGRNGNTSHSDDVLGRDLMTPDEVRMMPNEEEIVIIRGQYPVRCRKYRTENTDEFKEIEACGRYIVPLREWATPPGPRAYIQLMLTNQPEYNGTARIIATSLAQLRKLDPEGQGTMQPALQYEVVLPAVESAEEKDEQVVAKHDSVREQMKRHIFTDDQLQEAVMASADGLTEAQILEWFIPENSAKKMELLRKLQMQDLAQQRGNSKGRL